MNFKLYETFAANLARDAGKILLKHFQKKFAIHYKGTGKNNLVTAIDTLSEKFIIRNIRTAFPDHHILTEESGAIDTNSKNETKTGKKLQKNIFRWVIDPIDGTTNYAHGHPFFAVSIGLEVNGEIAAGAVYAPAYNELFQASKGRGAYLNGRRVHVSNIKTIDRAMLATGFPYQHKEKNFPYYEHFVQKAQGIRRCGAAALELSYLAAGRQDGFWEFNLQAWDFAAATIILEEADGKITNMEGKHLLLQDHDIIASNGKLHDQILKGIRTIGLHP